MEFQKTQSEEKKRREKEEADKKIAREVTEDFLQRREARRSIENSWLLNMNFLSGNQYCDVSPTGDLTEEDKRYYWQYRRVFNHIAPMVDCRVAKLEKLKPTLRVRAFSDEDGDIQAAKLATGVLKYVQERIGLMEIVSKGIIWSETCGSAFYKILWEEEGGRQVAVDEENKPIFEGEVRVIAVSPFEIYPDRLNVEDLDGVDSLIHAQVVPSSYIFERFGVAVQGGKQAANGYSQPSAAKNPVAQWQSGGSIEIEDGVVLIERYTKPTRENLQGKMEIVVGDRLLYSGPLPYVNEERDQRGFPFVKQDCMRLPGAFFGCSVVDRLIPVQRAYNAVRNRKHEFLNRLSMGVLTVEDGSVDTDDLSEEGLVPGKVLVYRQGGKAPEMLECGNVPDEFKDEEEWLEKEFTLISGVSDLSQNSTPMSVTSATGLQLLLSQDEVRLSATISSMQRAMKEMARQILRLYRQFAGTARLMTLTGENKKTQVYYFNAVNLAVNDVQFETEDATSPEEKKAALLQLYNAGLLTDENGKLSAENRNRILEAFGFGSYENARDLTALHLAKASEENIALKSGNAEVDEFDDHALHVNEHTRFLLSAEFRNSADSMAQKARYAAHIAEHQKRMKE